MTAEVDKYNLPATFELLMDNKFVFVVRACKPGKDMFGADILKSPVIYIFGLPEKPFLVHRHGWDSYDSFTMYDELGRDAVIAADEKFEALNQFVGALEAEHLKPTKAEPDPPLTLEVKDARRMRDAFAILRYVLHVQRDKKGILGSLL